MQLLFDFGFHMIGDDHHFADELLEIFYLDSQIILLAEIADLVVAVMAGSDDDLCPRRLDLIGLDPARSHPSFFERRPHGNIAAAPPATVVVFSAGGHVPEVIRQLPGNIPCCFR